MTSYSSNPPRRLGERNRKASAAGQETDPLAACELRCGRENFHVRLVGRTILSDADTTERIVLPTQLNMADRIVRPTLLLLLHLLGDPGFELLPVHRRELGKIGPQLHCVADIDVLNGRLR